MGASPSRRVYPTPRLDRVTLDRGNFMIRLAGSMAALGEVALGPETAAAFARTLGSLQGQEVEALFREGWGITRPFTPEQYAQVIGDLKTRIGGEFHLVDVDAEKVIVRAARCPFVGAVPPARSLCAMAGSLIGDIAARNFGYAKVVHRRSVAAGDEGCEIVVYLRDSPESQTERGVECYASAAPSGANLKGESAGVHRVSVLGRELRQRLRSLDLGVDRCRLLGDAARLFKPGDTVAAVLQEVAELAHEEFGGMCAVYPHFGEDVASTAAVVAHSPDPSVIRSVRELLERIPRIKEVAARWDSASGRVLVPDVLDSSLGASPGTREAVQEAGFASLLVLPLMSQSRRLATLVCLSGRERRLNEADLALASRFAELASAALATAREQEELRKALDARDAFVSLASHELLNALTSMRALTQISTRALQKGTPEGAARLEHILGLMTRQIDRLAELTRNLLDVSNIDSGRMQLQLRREPTSLNSVLVSVIERFQGILGEHARHRLRTEMPKVQLVGLWDRERIDQVLTNLLANAIKFSPNGGLLTVRAERQGARRAPVLALTPEARSEGEPPMAVVMVRDQGIGIPSDRLGSIFDAHSQASNSKGEPSQGLGLGLHICKGIVEAHGGRIWAESQPGRGSTFYFSLPLQE